MQEINLPDMWKRFCQKGKIPARYQRESVRKSLTNEGILQGYYSGIELSPDLEDTNALYPSHDHLAGRDDHTKMVVDARFINDMTTILSEDEFWSVVEHLYAVGLAKGKIMCRQPQKLPARWCPRRSYAGPSIEK